MCSDCKWSTFYPGPGGWKERLTELHIKESEPFMCPIIRKDLAEADSFMVGCLPCANAGLTCVFAKFEVCTTAHLQLVSLRRHCESPRHVAACRKMGIDVVISQAQSKKFEIAANSPCTGKFLWSLTTSFTHSTFRDYRKFMQTDEVKALALRKQIALQDETAQQSDSMEQDMASRAGNSRTCRTTTTSIATVLDRSDQAIMRRAMRMSYSVDDADQTRVMKLRMACMNPVVQVHSMVAGVIRDPGHSIDDAVEATWEGIRQACIIRQGPLDPQTLLPLSGEQPKVCEKLVSHCASTLISGASDGCEVEVQAVPRFKKKYAKHMRYFWRDTGHVTGCTHKAIMKLQAHEDVRLIEILVTGKASFAKRCQYSRHFRKLWSETQKMSVEDLLEVCSCLCYNETRYHSRTDPMTMLLGKWTSVLSVLIMVSKSTEASRDEVRWAVVIIQETSGIAGFQRMASFASEADFFCLCSGLIKQHDDDKHKLAVSQYDLENTVSKAEVLFGEGYVFDEEPNASFTWRFMDSLKADCTVYFGPDSIYRASIGWHGIDPKLLERPLRFARTLYLQLKEFMTCFFPGYAWRARFRAFDNSATKLAMEVRLDHFEAIAKKEGLCPRQARSQFYDILKDGEASRLFQQYACEERVWIILVERQRIASGSTRFRPDRMVAVVVIVVFLCIEYKTGPIERIFSRLSMLETRHRERHLSLFSLRDSLKIAVQLPHEIHLYVMQVSKQTEDFFKIRDIVPTGKIIEAAKECHVELFAPPRETKIQSLTMLGPMKRARIEARDQALGVMKSQSVKVDRGTGKQSKAERMSEWRESVDHLVDKYRQRKAAEADGTAVGPRRTIFGTEVKHEHLPRSAAQKLQMRRLRKHAADAKVLFEKEESELGISRSVKPFRTTNKAKLNRNAVPRLGVPAKLVMAAKASAKTAVIDRMNKDEKKAHDKGERVHFKDADVKKADWVKKVRIVDSVKVSEVNKMPEWAGLPRTTVKIASVPKSVPAASARGGHIPGMNATYWTDFKHKVWALNDVTSQALATVALGDTWLRGTDKTDATMFVVEGQWKKVVDGSPTSFLCRTLGRAIAHIDFIRDSSSDMKPVHFLPLSNGCRVSTFRVFISDACRDKHKTFESELRWLADLPKVKPHIPSRYKFEIISGDDAGALLNQLKGCTTTNQVNSYRWLVTKDEVDSATIAVAGTISLPPANVKCVMTVSSFIASLGKCRDIEW